MQRQKLAEAKAALALEQSRRKVLALQLTMDENDRMVDSVSSEIETLSREGAIESGAAMKLEGVMRGHTALKRDQENFLTLFAEISNCSKLFYINRSDYFNVSSAKFLNLFLSSSVV